MPRSAQRYPPPKLFKLVSSSFNKEPDFWRIEERPGVDGDAPSTRLFHTRQSRVGQPDEAFGTRLMSKGEHRFVITLDELTSPSGSGLLLGVADGADNGYSRFKYGIRVSDGRCVQYPTPEDARNVKKTAAEGFLGSARAVRAVDRRVEVVVDMDRRAVAFSVDGMTVVDSGILPGDLPDSLVPWCQIYYKGDAVILSHHRTRATAGKPPATPPPVRVPPPSKVYDMSAVDSGPWTP